MASVYEEASAEPPRAPEPAAPPRRRRWPGLLFLLILAFAGGIGAAGWSLRRWPPIARYLVPPQPAPRPVVQVVRVPTPVNPRATPAGGDASLAEQVAAIDIRLDAIDARAREAVGGADRAEGLLVAFAARRAIERGSDLGYLEAMLRAHFGASQPQALATVISGARQPVTLAELRTGLAEARDALTQGEASESSWAAFRRELSNLMVLHRNGTDSAAPVDRFDRATTAMDFGQVDRALAEVARMPGRNGAAAWIAKARRYIAVRNALDTLETAALIDPSGPTAGR